MRPLILLTALSACADRGSAEDWRDWYADAAPAEVQETVAFTEEPYDLPADPADGILALREDLLTQQFNNDGPVFAPGELPAGATDCAFWDPVEAPDDTDAEAALPREITGWVTSHPRVYRKIEGCTAGGKQSDEKYYGSFHLEDATGGIFVLNDSKVAAFDIGAKVTIRVRAVRRRFGIDMVYVHDLVEVDRGPFPLHVDEVARPLQQGDQSMVRRVTGTVLTEPTTFGEVILRIDGYDGGTCDPATRAGRAHCLFANLDQEIARRGVALTPGERVTLTGPVSQTVFFDEQGPINFYGLYLTRVGQIARHDAAATE